MSKIWSLWIWDMVHNLYNISIDKVNWPSNSLIKYQVLLNHFLKSSMIHKKIIIFLIKLWGSSKKILLLSNMSIKRIIIDRLKLHKKHKNYQEHLKLLKLLINRKRHHIKTYYLRQNSFKKKLSIWIKKWKINFVQHNKKFNLNYKNTILISNKIRQWTKKLRTQFKIYKRFYNKIWIKS